MRIVLRNAAIVTEGSPVAENVNLQIDDTKISSITREDLSTTAECDVLIDGSGKLAIPGLINAHNQLSMLLFRGPADDISLKPWSEKHIWPIERNLGSREVYWSSLLGMAEMIRSGTTLFADMYFHADRVGRAIEEAGLRAVVSYGISAERLDRHGKTELARGEEIIEHWHNAASGRIQAAISLHAPYTCGEKVWERAVELAGEHGVLLHTCLAETSREVRWCREQKGVTPTAYLNRIGVFSVPTLAAHCVHLNNDDIHLLAEREVKVVHCPRSNAKLAAGNSPVSMMLRNGITVALGTDGAASHNSLSMIEEMRIAALLGKGLAQDPTVLSAQEVFEMATTNGASALNEELGALSVGKEADIVLVEMDGVYTLPAYDPLSTLVYSAQTENVTDVIVVGRILLRDRELLIIDEEKVREEVKCLADRYKN